MRMDRRILRDRRCRQLKIGHLDRRRTDRRETVAQALLWQERTNLPSR